MKKFKLISILVLTLVIQVYANKYMVEKDFVESIFKNPFQILKIEHPKVKKTLDEYFTSNTYKVIWAKPYGYDNKMVYFAVEEYMPEKYYNSIKRGIVVKEDGEIDSYLDTEKGLYNDREKIIDFEEIGFKKNEIKCIILKEKKYKLGETYWINLIDKDDNNISVVDTQGAASFSYTGITFVKQKSKRAKYIVFDELADIGTPAETLRLYQDKLQEYRQAKAQGKAVKSAAVKAEFEKYKKAGLIEEF